MRGYRMAGPFTRQALALSMSGCISGATALLQNSPQLLLLGAVLPHKLRVRDKSQLQRWQWLMSWRHYWQHFNNQ